MDIFLAILILIGSLFLLFVGGNKLVDSSVAIAHRFHIPTPIIGATLVSLGTTIPEVLVTIFSINNNAGDIAVGNSFGSIIFDSCLLGGILFSFCTIKLKKSWHIDYIILITSCALLFALSFDKKISIGASLALLVIFLLFLIVNYLQAVKYPTKNDEFKQKHSLLIYFVIFILSTVAVGAGAYFLVQKATFLAKLAGLSNIFIGLTIIAFGTSLPELVTTISAIRKKQQKLIIGNLVGSNIINFTLLIGLVGILTKGNTNISTETLYITLPLTFISTLFLVLPLIIKNKSYKWQGIVLLCLFALYYTYLILNIFDILII